MLQYSSEVIAEVDGELRTIQPDILEMVMKMPIESIWSQCCDLLWHKPKFPSFQQ